MQSCMCPYITFIMNKNVCMKNRDISNQKKYAKMIMMITSSQRTAEDFYVFLMKYPNTFYRIIFGISIPNCLKLPLFLLKSIQIDDQKPFVWMIKDRLAIESERMRDTLEQYLVIIFIMLMASFA